MWEYYNNIKPKVRTISDYSKDDMDFLVFIVYVYSVNNKGYHK